MLSGLSFYLVPKLLASDLILTVDAAAGKAGIWPGGSLQNSEFIGGDTFLLLICLRGRDKRASRLCLCLAVYLHHGHGTRPCPPWPRTPQATVGPLRTEPRPGRPAPSAAPRHCQRLCPPAPALPGAAGTRRSFNPPLATTPIPGLPPVGPPALPHPPALVAAGRGCVRGFSPREAQLFLRGSRDVPSLPSRPDPGRLAAHGPHPGPQLVSRKSHRFVGSVRGSGTAGEV